MPTKHVRHLLLSLAMGICAATTRSPVAGQTLHYRTFAADTDSTLWRFSVAVPRGDAMQGEQDGGPHSKFIQWRSESGDMHAEDLRVEEGGNTREWSVHFPERFTEYRGVRVDDRLGVSGTIEGEVINREFTLGSDPLYANVALGLAAFVRSGERETDFWTFRPDDRSVIHMSARRESVGTLPIEERPLPAVQVRVAPKGWRGLFYSRRFWFRASDGVLLRTDERDGRITELVADAPGTSSLAPNR